MSLNPIGLLFSTDSSQFIPIERKKLKIRVKNTERKAYYCQGERPGSQRRLDYQQGAKLIWAKRK